MARLISSVFASDKTSKNIVNNKLPADLSKKFQSKKGSKESNENVILITTKLGITWFIS